MGPISSGTSNSISGGDADNVDDVRVYNRALTPVEVSAVFRERGFSP